jgi:hypothetical protein
MDMLPVTVHIKKSEKAKFNMKKFRAVLMALFRKIAIIVRELPKIPRVITSEYATTIM